MPFADVNNIELYYEIHGPPEAPPIVLIGGWASYRWIWFRQVPAFKSKYRCIVFDNRGAGRSSKPDHRYTIQMFADDTVGLMDALEIGDAHILGISMGGLIAQQIAISYPERTRSLIVVSSHFGGPNQIRMDDRTMALLIALPTETITKEQAREMRYKATFSPDFIQANRAVLEQIDKWAEKYPTPVFAQVHQSNAVGEFNSESQLKQISTPTLVIHGDRDLAVPTKNGEMIASKIPNSHLVLIEGGSHFSIIERYREFNEAAIGFVDEVEKG